VTSDVPVIDIAGWQSGNDADRAAIAAVIDDACRTSGFFQIIGHGFPEDVLHAALDAIDDFFALPTSVKLESAPPADNINRGFLPLGSEALSYSVGVDSAVDLREAFVMGPDTVTEDARRNDPYNVFTPNIWPAGAGALRPAMIAYFDAVVDLSLRIMDIYAIALALPADFFHAYLDHSTETLRVNYYEQLADAHVLDGQQRLGAHTDYGITTVLYADPVPGLQLLTADGVWHDVLPEPGAFIVNLGDLLAQWTNDRWRSTIHRVVPALDRGERRRSLAFFLDGNFDATIECLSTCHDETDPPRYPPTTAGEHLAAKLRGARTLTKADAMDTVGDRLSRLST